MTRTSFLEALRALYARLRRWARVASLWAALELVRVLLDAVERHAVWVASPDHDPNETDVPSGIRVLNVTEGLDVTLETDGTSGTGGIPGVPGVKVRWGAGGSW